MKAAKTRRLNEYNGDSRIVMTSPCSSPSPQGVPRVAPLHRQTAPVHIDVGGTMYTSSLETLTKYPNSKISKLFSGQIPIVLDGLKQHYFIDRDGPLFRNVLNFLRTSKLNLPLNFNEMDALYEEVRYYELHEMLDAMDALRSSNQRQKMTVKGENTDHECVIIQTTPDCGERINISGDKNLIHEVFPEVGSVICNSAGSNYGWTQESNYVIRFPLNGYCKLNMVQVLQRFLQTGFNVVASSGGGLEGSQFSEYVLSRKP
ncbi:BTB/POZ domain-containing protein kctd15-like [Anneissia japonica]|uniref:BTB/POZ domain-containing protein kctd15-like n=1 Tax=Anneissia japonica TaxID=1529436 RepID=UPI0014255D5B|nr:BTB/POZ domain-containing protein kctd15-like [Anneissia japonica]XP_033124790.1 BTB/POZ domain-containing protein kctd15-like [Anneissia japonica]XP_033124791.1 BTB/POZ domain-containing protein kctd15-like [Anneissia japonica]